VVQPFDYMHKSGTAGLTLQNYAARPDLIVGNPSSLPDTLLAQPFWTGDEPLSIAGLGINCTSTGTATIQIALYDVPSTRNLYPGNLLHDFGVVNYSATGVRLASLSVTLPANKMFWLVTNTPGGTGQHAGVTSSNEVTLPAGPLSVSSQAALGLFVSRSFALGMPATFPAGAATRNNQFGVYPAIVIVPA